jgi:hypothetical protein
MRRIARSRGEANGGTIHGHAFRILAQRCSPTAVLFLPRLRIDRAGNGVVRVNWRVPSARIAPGLPASGGLRSETASVEAIEPAASQTPTKDY